MYVPLGFTGPEHFLHLVCKACVGAYEKENLSISQKELLNN